MNAFARVYARLERRQRFLRGLSAMSWTLCITLGLTAIALIFFVPRISLLGWLVGNIALAGVAFVWGWFRALDMTKTIWRADRNAHCDEKLITLYELSRGQGPREFLPLLVSRFESRALDLSAALPIEPRERRRWLGVLALALLCLGMTSMVHSELSLWSPTDVPERAVSPQSPEAAPISRPETYTVELAQPPPAALAQKLTALRERLERARAALAQNPNDARARALLQQLQEEIRQEQNKLLNPPPPPEEGQAPPPDSEKSRDDASLVENPPGDTGLPKNNTMPQGQSALDRLMQTLRDLQGQAQGLSPEEMQKLLEQLRQQNPDAAAIAQRALQTAPNDQEFREKLEEALKNLEARRDLHRELEQLQREAQSALSQSERPQPQTAQSDDTQTPGSPEGAQPPQEGTQNPQEAEAESESPEGPRQENALAKPAGGRGTAPLDPQAVQDLPDLSQLRERTRTMSVPGSQEEQLEILFEIVSIGLPQNPDTPGQPAPVQIDYQKVEVLLDALEIPAEMREAVRQYFLSLAKPSP